MPRDGSGNYALPAGNPVVTATAISSTVHNNTLTDIATALTASLTADGQKVASANQPMGGNRHTNVGDALLRTQYAGAGQVQDGALHALSAVSGTNTYVGSMTPALPAYVTDMFVVFTPTQTSTGASTLNINGLGARSILKFSGTALVAGDLVAGVPALVIFNAAANAFILLNPQTVIPNDSVTFARMQNINADRLIGRDTAGAGDPEEISVGGGLEFTGGAAIQRSALTGEVTAAAGSNATTIANDAVTNARLANMGQATVKGRQAGAGTGDPEDLTAAQLLTILLGADGAGSGLDADLLDGLNSTQFARLAAASDFTTAPTINGATIWTSANDGAGSGLDADLLDGQSSAAFAAAAHTHPETDIVNGALLARLGESNSFTAGQAVTISALADAANIAVNAALSNVFRVVLGGNRTMDAPTNPRSGQTITFIIRQDATGSRTLAWNAIYRFPGGVDPVLSTGANDVDVFSFMYDDTSNVWLAPGQDLA